MNIGFGENTVVSCEGQAVSLVELMQWTPSHTALPDVVACMHSPHTTQD